MTADALRHALVGCAVAVAGFGALSGSASGQEVRVLTPVDGAVIHSPSALVVFTAPAGTKVSIGVGKGVLDVPDTTAEGSGEEVHHLRVPLPEGKVLLRLLDAGGVEELARLTVTRVGPLGPDAPSVEAFHTVEGERACSGCHSLPSEGDGGPNRPPEPLCQPCHPDVGLGPYQHGPSAVADCFSCHEARYVPARFGQKLSQPASCAACHTDLMARVLGGKKFVHGPVAAGDCTACHDPHGGQTDTLLRGTVSGLCLSCHDAKVRRAWSVSLHEKLPCTGCHDPHGSQTPKLTLAQGNGLCTRCHVEPAFNALGHALFGHPLGEVADPSRPGKTFGCMSCHPPHGANDVSRRLIERNEAEQRTFCLGCHR